MKMKKKRKSNKIFAAFSAVLVLLCVAVWFPEVLGVESYYVKTGSMEPNIPKGSMVYIEKIEINDIQPGIDILLFSNEAENKSFTHRVMSVDYENEMVVTKGDASKVSDPLPTPFANCKGRVLFFFPYWGYVVQALNTVWGKVAIALLYIVWLAVEIEKYKSEKKAVKA